MSLRVKHLNADTSFLLIFTPPLEAAQSDRQGTFPGSFTVLVDPWLSPDGSVIFHKHFATSIRKVPACVESLSDLPEPDVILISQDKPDHCHRETLCSLDPDTKATIFAVPAAAKKVRSWKHFPPEKVMALPRYDERRPDTVLRIPLPAFSLTGQPGEITICNMSPKLDVTGLHQALGITYRPPSSPLSNNRSTSYIPLLPPSPPSTPPAVTFDQSPLSNPGRSSFLSRRSYSSLQAYRRTVHEASPPVTPPRTESSASSTLSNTTLAISHPVSTRLDREKAISVLYSPHGLPYNYIKPWVTGHALQECALPLTALFHGLQRTGNPWYLGGNILAGAENGLDIALALKARHWFVAHDEDKENTGLSVKTLSVKAYDVQDVREKLSLLAGDIGKSLRTELLDLESGEEYLCPAI